MQSSIGLNNTHNSHPNSGEPGFDTQSHGHWLNHFSRASKPETLVRMARSAANKNKENTKALIAIRIAEDLREAELINAGFTRLDFDYADSEL
ncbi:MULTISPECIES: hypothetical protein [Aeromonas]|uniref:Uncharacterized protein n=1 Tax=Aeromonas veronii TaxID=654 RepID=A0A4S5CJU6_AERVE|nr:MULTISPECIES: hypothetical protein [Aeromonas]THJ43628.1 hypothetical protein E8Q35_15080 [Aeromonas veronii]